MDEWLYLASKQKEYCVFPSFCVCFSFTTLADILDIQTDIVLVLVLKILYSLDNNN